MGDVQSVVIKPDPTGPEAPKPEVQADPNRPAFLPEKFKTVEDLAKSYAELEKKLGSQGQQKAPEPSKTPDPKPADSAPLEKQAEEAVVKAGLDMKALQAEFLANGDISPESYAKLEAVGIGKDQVETFKEGVKAKATTYENQILSGVDRGEFKSAADWADQNWPKEDAEAFNKAMESGDPLVGKMAIKGLMADYKKSLGPQRIEGGKGLEEANVFRSRAEQLRAMRDERYATDPAYRQDVVDKSMRSKF